MTLYGYKLHFLTGKAIRNFCHALNLRSPMNMTDMYLSSEPVEYLQAAVMAVNQSGE